MKHDTIQTEFALKRSYIQSVLEAHVDTDIKEFDMNKEFKFTLFQMSVK